MGERILKSELAGTWYVEDAGRLAVEIDSYLDAVEEKPVEDVRALLLPHAGYRYSGMVAAHGVSLVREKNYKRVIVIGPSHRVAMMDAVSIPDVTHIETPLGRIEVDQDAVGQLYGSPLIQSHPRAHLGEHSVQIQFPFLQRALGDFKIVPMVCGQLDETSAVGVGEALLPLLDDETLVVVSSDFTHYGGAFDYVPFKDDIERNLESLDLGAFRQIERKDLSGFLKYVQNTGATICGRSPIAVLLSMCSDQSVVKRLKYETSGSLTGDWSHCVSYIAAVVSGAWREPVEVAETASLSDDDKRLLLHLARECIAARFRSDSAGPDVKITPAMNQVMGAFVTLHKYGQLRGCIGEIIPQRPLVEAVMDQAVNAAFHDPRFPKLREDELDLIDLEISALTPPRTVESFEDIRIGTHGIVLHKKGYSAVFLPQVAPEQGWDLETTLTHLSMKAGLGPDDWQNDCEFQVFEAIVFSEH